MSLLDSFGFVFQIRRNKLLDMIQEHVVLQGQGLDGPIRLVVPGVAASAFQRKLNAVDLLVKGSELALQPGSNFCTLSLQLEGGVIRLPDAADVVFSGGAVKVRIQLLDGTFLIARLLDATLEAPATAASAGIAGFAARANTEVNKLIQREPNKDFELIPGESSVKALFIIFGKNLNLDADTLALRVGEGDAARLTPSVSSSRPISLAIAAEVIKRQLPDAKSFSRDPVTVNSVNLTFREGVIDVDGTFDAEGDCWSVDGGSFTQKLHATLVQNNVEVVADPPAPVLAYEVEFGFLCNLLIDVLSVLQTIILPITPLLGATLRQIFDSLGAVAPDTEIPDQPSWAVPQISWLDLRITGEGLLLSGDRGGVSIAHIVPAIHLRTKEDPQNLHGVARGSVTVQPLACEPRTFAYEESIQDDRKILTVEQEWLFDPVTYAWTVNGEPLASRVGTVVQPGAGDPAIDFIGTVTSALPPPNGTAINGHATELHYRLEETQRGPDSRLVLNARNQDANYNIRVEVRATDAIGRHFSDAVNLEMLGDIAEFGEDFDDYMDQCMKAAADLVNKKGQTRSKVKPGQPQESWRELVDIVSLQIREGNPEAAALVPSMTKAFGVQVVSRSLAGKALTKRVQ